MLPEPGDCAVLGSSVGHRDPSASGCVDCQMCPLSGVTDVSSEAFKSTPASSSLGVGATELGLVAGRSAKEGDFLFRIRTDPCSQTRRELIFVT